MLLGLDSDNIARLLDDRPIYFTTDVLGIHPALQVFVIAGATQDDMRKYIASERAQLLADLSTTADHDQPPPTRPGPADYAAAEAALEALPRDASYAPADVVHVVLNAAYAARANRWAAGRSFTCSRCLMTSPDADDVANGYCGHCHDFTGTPGGPNPPRPGG